MVSSWMELCWKHLPASHRPVHDICVLPGRTPGHRYSTPHKPRHGWTQRGWRLCQGHGHEPPAQPCAPWLGLSQLLICCCQVPAASCQRGEGGQTRSANDGLHLEPGRVHSQVLPIRPGAWSLEGHQQLEVACAKIIPCLLLGTLPCSKPPLIPLMTVLVPSYCFLTTHGKQHLLQSHKSTSYA